MTIYYKNNQLRKTKTIKSVLLYYMSERLHGRKPIKPIIESSYKLEAF